MEKVILFDLGGVIINWNDDWLYDEINLSGIKLTNNWVEPSASQRRHLSKPLILGVPTSSGKN